jgi:hypothetical protein
VSEALEDTGDAPLTKRRLPSPLDLSPGADVTGSAFFPLLPQPKALAMKDHTSKGEAELK